MIKEKIMAGIMTAAFCVCSAFLSEVPRTAAEITTVYGDVNGDGVVNVIDSIYLKQNAIGTNDSFPVTNWRAAVGASGGDRAESVHISMMNSRLLTPGEHEDSGKEIKTYSGIDVSKWQGDVDWNRVRAAGIDFVMIKAGEGTSVEPKFLQNITGAKQAGIQCGVYWFANARNIDDCRAEARACIETIKPYQLEYPVVYDFEYRTFVNDNPLQNDREQCTDVIYTFLEEIENAGYYAMMYSNRDFPDRYLNIRKITDRFDFWYANYGIEQPDVSCGIWQRSCTGRVDGIAYDVDLDISYIDYKSIMEKNNLNGF